MTSLSIHILGSVIVIQMEYLILGTFTLKMWMEIILLMYSIVVLTQIKEYWEIRISNGLVVGITFLPTKTFQLPYFLPMVLDGMYSICLKQISSVIPLRGMQFQILFIIRYGIWTNSIFGVIRVTRPSMQSMILVLIAIIIHRLRPSFWKTDHICDLKISFYPIVSLTG